MTPALPLNTALSGDASQLKYEIKEPQGKPGKLMLALTSQLAVLGWTYKANKANKEPVGCDPIMEKPPAPLPSPVPYLLLERQRLINPVS